MRFRSLIAAAGLLLPATAVAAETITYSYDAKGRLVTVHHDGGGNDNLNVNYAFDPADNRTNVSITGASGHFIVLPLGVPVLLPLGG